MPGIGTKKVTAPHKIYLLTKGIVMTAIIILHEIYGINQFIDMQCEKYKNWGFRVYCPDFYNKLSFDYEKADDAYTFFYNNVGLNAYDFIWNLVDELKSEYEDIYIIGYSVGATLAWRCSENPNCTGIIACYGSRIRDYLNVTPKCPVLLMFAEKDSFDVTSVMKSLNRIPNTTVTSFPSEHGFLDSYSQHYDALQAKDAEAKIMCFLGYNK